MLSIRQRKNKRLFDIVLAAIGVIVFFVPVLILLIIASISTKKQGLFKQERVGKDAELFTMYKIRTMASQQDDNFITTADDKRITGFGKFLRNYKLDEFPQLYNVLLGNMSFVGPRPDVSGYADKLSGEDRIILSVRPGITGPATIKYRNEEEILSQQDDPKSYNDMVIWKDKIEINKAYIEHWSFSKDLIYIYKTFFN